MKRKFINFDLIVNNLSINYLDLIEESIQKQLLSEMFFEMGVLKKFRNTQRKTPVLDSAFNKVSGLQLSREYCEIFKNTFFHKTPLVAASVFSKYEEYLIYFNVLRTFSEAVVRIRRCYSMSS